MSTRAAPARVLVASDEADTALRLVEELKADHEQVAASTEPRNAAADFEALHPDVLVLAFGAIEKAQRYSLSLYRQSRLVNEHPHRTVLLCSSQELQAAFELCCQGVFDDYVLHAPDAGDPLRLRMTVWAAAREARAMSGPSARDLVKHAEQLGAMESALHRHLQEGDEHVAAATQTLRMAEAAVAAAIDAFSHRLLQREEGAGAAVSDAARLAREIERLKSEHVAPAFKGSADGMVPVAAWSGEARERLAPHMAGMRTFARKVTATRWTVLVVEDDEFARKMLARTLEDEPYGLVFAKDGADAFGVLRRTRPHLILMDVNLPDMDGVKLTRKLKEAPHLSDIPILMLTGQARREVLESSMSAGAAGFIVKPYTRETLIGKIEAALPPAPQP